MSEQELEDLKWQQTEYEENIIGELIKENNQLKSQLQQKENIIKEVREYANQYNDKIQKDILEILDKENK